ncbi:MAG: dihydroneopterin aldolase [Candidatus Omnitrophica bacterium]|nr:dihydroneopterin aldolase [Candidatus Omnitrophota bacterium]
MIIHIPQFPVSLIIGTKPVERRRRQNILLDIIIEYRGEKAARTDQLTDTLDYAAMMKKILEAIQPTQFFLLEKLGAAIAALILQEPLVQNVKVCVTKPDALGKNQPLAVKIDKYRF